MSAPARFEALIPRRSADGNPMSALARPNREFLSVQREGSPMSCTSR